MKYTPEDSAPAPTTAAPGRTPVGAAPQAPSLFTTLQEELGLKLESAKGPVEVLVIDHVQKPDAN